MLEVLVFVLEVVEEDMNPVLLRLLLLGALLLYIADFGGGGMKPPRLVDMVLLLL